MVDEGGDAPVGVQLEVLRVLLLADLDVDVDDVELQPQLLQDNSDLPERIKSFAGQLQVTTTCAGSTKRYRSQGVGPNDTAVESELLARRHCGKFVLFER